MVRTDEGKIIPCFSINIYYQVEKRYKKIHSTFHDEIASTNVAKLFGFEG
jgi:phosphopantothenate synthetase